MMIRFIICATLALSSLQPVSALSFEVASITPCPPGTRPNPLEHTGRVNFVLPGGRFEAKATTAQFLFQWAYNLQPMQHSKGPAWFGTDRFDVLATAPPTATESEMRQMVQTVLAERFHLTFHREQRELPVYVFSIGKSSPKLTPSAGSETQSLEMSRTSGPDARFPTAHIVATRFSIAELADTFARQLDRPILDQTGLRGTFNFTLDITPDETRPTMLDPTLLFTALREQVGLQVKADRAMTEFFVIDHADKEAAGN